MKPMIFFKYCMKLGYNRQSITRYCWNEFELLIMAGKMTYEEIRIKKYPIFYISSDANIIHFQIIDYYVVS